VILGGGLINRCTGVGLIEEEAPIVGVVTIIHVLRAGFDFDRIMLILRVI